MWKLEYLSTSEWLIQLFPKKVTIEQFSLLQEYFQQKPKIVHNVLHKVLNGKGGHCCFTFPISSNEGTYKLVLTCTKNIYNTVDDILTPLFTNEGELLNGLKGFTQYVIGDPVTLIDERFFEKKIFINEFLKDNFLQNGLGEQWLRLLNDNIDMLKNNNLEINDLSQNKVLINKMMQEKFKLFDNIKSDLNSDIKINVLKYSEKITMLQKHGGVIR